MTARLEINRCRNNRDNAIKKQQELMESMKKAKQDYDLNIEDEDEDDMEDYFLDNLSSELVTQDNPSQQNKYTDALTKLEEIKKSQSEEDKFAEDEDQDDEYPDEPDDDMEERLMKDIHQSMKQETSQLEEVGTDDNKAEFAAEYASLIEEFQKFSRRLKPNIKKISEITDRVWRLVDEWRNQDRRITLNWYKETLLKGLLLLVDNNDPKAVFMLWKWCIHIIDSIYNEKLRLSEDQRKDDNDFIKIFNSLLSAVKILFRYSKGEEYDSLYGGELNIFEVLLHIISDYYIDGRDILDQLTMKVLRKTNSSEVEIKNTDTIFDLLIYIVGILKNSSMNKMNQNILHNKNAIQILSKLWKTVMNEEDGVNAKIPQLFVQITGWYRNLAIEQQQIEIFIQEGALVALAQMMSNFKKHKELNLNIVRILSKLSLNDDALAVMNLFGDEFLLTLSELVLNNADSNAILIRASFVLGNLTTLYSECRLSLLKDARFFTQLLDLSHNFFEKDLHKKKSKDKKIDFNQESTEEALTKIIRLIANLLTEPNSKKLLEINKQKIDMFFRRSMQTLQVKKLENSEEWILNIVAWFTNFLFYDTGEFSIFTDEKAEILRQNWIKKVGLYIFQSNNDELKVESMRVLCNLSRNKEWWSLIVDSETLLKVLVEVLDNNVRDLVFYNIGLLINIALNPVGRKKVTKMCLKKLIEILKCSNIEDLDMSKVVWKAIVSFWEEKFLWDNSDIQAVDDIWTEIGEELDMIMDVGTEAEKEILMQLRYLINQVINNLPEITFNWKVENWGRKFKSNEELDEHLKRRHGK
jgi:hypothetical protein